MSLHSFGDFSFTSAGTGTRIAAGASSPSVARRRKRRRLTMLLSTVISTAGTFHVVAAAVTNIRCAAGPTLRICSHELAIDVEAPVAWLGPKKRLLES